MMRMFSFVWAGGFLLFLSNFCVAAEQNGISVSGKATITKEPDQFLIQLSITERGVSAAKAKQRVDLISKNVINSVKSFGIKDNELKSTQLRINPVYTRNRVAVDKVYMPVGQHKEKQVASIKANNINNKEVPIEFDVTRQIEITLANFSVYEALLDKVTGLGVTRISPAQSSISNAEDLYQRALELAVSNAQQKAKKLAKQLGIKLGNVTKIEELSYRAPGKIQMASEAIVSGARMQSHTGLNEVSAEVRLSFSISAH